MERRVHLLLDEPRYRKVTDVARRRGSSLASVIREAIDRLPADQQAREAAIARILDADAMPVPPDPADLRREVDSTRAVDR